MKSKSKSIFYKTQNYKYGAVAVHVADYVAFIFVSQLVSCLSTVKQMWKTKIFSYKHKSWLFYSLILLPYSYTVLIELGNSAVTVSKYALFWLFCTPSKWWTSYFILEMSLSLSVRSTRRRRRISKISTSPPLRRSKKCILTQLHTKFYVTEWRKGTFYKQRLETQKSPLFRKQLRKSKKLAKLVALFYFFVIASHYFYFFVTVPKKWTFCVSKRCIKSTFSLLRNINIFLLLIIVSKIFLRIKFATESSKPFFAF